MAFEVSAGVNPDKFQQKFQVREALKETDAASLQELSAQGIEFDTSQKQEMLRVLNKERKEHEAPITSLDDRKISKPLLTGVSGLNYEQDIKPIREQLVVKYSFEEMSRDPEALVKHEVEGRLQQSAPAKSSEQKLGEALASQGVTIGESESSRVPDSAKSEKDKGTTGLGI